MDRTTNIRASGRGRAAQAAQLVQVVTQLGSGPSMATIGSSGLGSGQTAAKVDDETRRRAGEIATALAALSTKDTASVQTSDRQPEHDMFMEFHFTKDKRYPLAQRRVGDRGSVATRQLPVFSNHFEVQFAMPRGAKELGVAVYAVHIINDLDQLSTVRAIKSKPLSRDERLELFWRVMQKDEKARPLVLVNKQAVAYDGDSLLYVSPAAETLFKSCIARKFQCEAQLYMDSRPYPYTVMLDYRGSGTVSTENLGLPIVSNIQLPDGRHMDVFPTDLLDAVLRQSPGNLAFQHGPVGAQDAMTSIMLGNALFPLPGTPQATEMPIDLGATQNAWFGQYFAPKLTTDYKIMLNIDTTTAVFYKDMSLLEFVCGVLNEEERAVGRYRPDDINQTTTLGVHHMNALNRHLKGLKVTTTHTGQKLTHTIFKMGEAPDAIEFMQRDGTATTVLRYFKEAKNYEIKNLKLQCIVCGRGKRTCALPIELCRIAIPQRSKRDLPEDAVSIMIKRLCTVASDRKARIERVASTKMLGQDEWTNHFGVKISDSMIRIPDARVIEAPTIVNAQNMNVQVREGVWKGDRARLIGAASISAYAIVDLCNIPDAQTIQFCQTLIQQARAMGIQVAVQNEMAKFTVRTSVMNLRRTIERDVVEKFTNENFPKDGYLIFFIFEKRNPYAYSVIKSISDKETGFKSQCLLKKNIIPQLRPMTAQNILLKMNVKLGGSNWTLRPPQAADVAFQTLSEPGTLILGMDVIHSSGPDERRLPSIAAVVGNIDHSLSKWRTSVKFGAIGQESVHYIKNAIEERIAAYHSITGIRPKRLIVYRDGVADSMFEKTLSEELQCLQGALNDLGLTETKITLIICVKRHHARFFVANPADACGRAGNVPPGLVVDHGVTHPKNIDFFLVSHFGLQGTSRPTHYYVLHDDNDLSLDTLSRMTYQLCHVYARCTRTVSLPAPVYYADLVAERIKVHFHHKMNPIEGGASGSDSAESVRKQFRKQSMIEQGQDFKLAEDQRVNAMFWM